MNVNNALNVIETMKKWAVINRLSLIIAGSVGYRSALARICELEKCDDIDCIFIYDDITQISESPFYNKNFYDTVCKTLPLKADMFSIKQVMNGIKIVLPDDEFVSPTHVNLLSDQIERVIITDASGILHCCGNDRISRYEMGLVIAEYYGYKNNVIQAKGIENPLRPKDVSLNCRYTEKLLDMKFPDFKNMLYTYM